MERLTEIEHDIVRRVDDIVDASLPHRFERLHEPLGRRADGDPANIAGDVSLTETRLIDLHLYEIRRGLKNGHVSQRIELHRQLQDGRELFGDTAI